MRTHIPVFATVADGFDHLNLFPDAAWDPISNIYINFKFLADQSISQATSSCPHRSRHHSFHSSFFKMIAKIDQKPVTHSVNKKSWDRPHLANLDTPPATARATPTNASPMGERMSENGIDAVSRARRTNSPQVLTGYLRTIPRTSPSSAWHVVLLEGTILQKSSGNFL